MKNRFLTLAVSLALCGPSGLTHAEDEALQQRKPPQGKGKSKEQPEKGKKGQKGKGPKGPRPPAFTPQTPFEVRGLLPYEDAVLRAAEKGLYYLLQEQRDDGAWDVSLTGQFLSKTADQAVDAVAITALCGQALRQNVHVDPDRINPALEKSSRFIIDRLKRGKLSTKVQYAIWRYTLGLRFLTMEYASSDDESYRQEIQNTVQFIVSQLQEMQLTTAKKNENKGITSMPAPLGLIVETTAAGGVSSAQVIEVLQGLTGAVSDIKIGDRIHRINQTPISSHYDFYRVEPGFMSGDVLEILLERDGDSRTVMATVEPVWPGSLDIKLAKVNNEGDEELADGVVVGAVAPGGTAHKAGLKKGDRLLQINEDQIANRAELKTAENNMLFGDEVTLLIERKGKEKTLTAKATPRFLGNLGMMPNVEDKSGLDGIVVSRLQPKGAAQIAGLKKNDRITHINGVPLQGVDHYISLSETYWAGMELELKVVRPAVKGKGAAKGKGKGKGKGGKGSGRGKTDIKTETESKTQAKEITIKAILKPRPTPPYFGISMSRQHQLPTVGQVHKGDPAHKAGIKPGDRLVELNGVKTPTHQGFMKELMKCRPGQTIDCKVIRKGKEKDFEITLAKKRPGPVIQEKGGAGGWNYYHMGVSTSFVTGATLINLLDAQEIVGVKVPEEMLKAAVHAIESMRVVDKAHGNLESYAYSGSTIPRDTDVRGHMGKIVCCELALVRASEAGLIPKKRRRDSEHLERALRTWLDFRGELDRVRDYQLTHYQGLFNNAAYYWLFGHYYGAMAADWLEEEGDDEQLIHEVRETTLKALMLKQKSHTGTWYGHQAFGPICGTSRALATLGLMGSTSENMVRGVHPELARVANHIQNDRYRVAWEDLQILENKEVEDDRFTEDLEYLADLLSQRSERVLEEFTRDWKYDPVVSIKNGEGFLKSFRGLPQAEEFRPLLEEWKNSKELDTFRSSIKKLGNIKKKIVAGGAFMKRKKADVYIKQLSTLEEEQKQTRIAGDALQLREALVASYESGGFLGINMDQRYQGGGAMISAIVPKSPAQIANLAAGDVILKVDGEVIKSMQGLPKLFKGYKPGDGAVLTVLKKGKKTPILVMIVLGRRFAMP